MSTNHSATTPPPGDSDDGFSCFFCEGEPAPDGKRRHVEGCEQAKIDAERLRMQADRLRNPPPPPPTPNKGTPGTPGNAQPPTTPQRPTPDGALGWGLPLGGSRDGDRRGLSQEEIEARLTPEQRDALRNLRLGKEQQAWKEAAKRPEDVAPPAWMRDMLTEQGVPEQFFSEFRGGSGLPNPEVTATPPQGDEAMMPFHPTPDPLIKAWWDALPTFEAFYDGLSDETVQTLREVKRALQRAYIDAGAMYGPSEAGMLQWAGEVTAIQRNMVKTAEIAARQQARLAVNQRFPKFWRGEWEVPGYTPAGQPTPPLPGAPAENNPAAPVDGPSITPEPAAAQPEQPAPAPQQQQQPSEPERPPAPPEIDTSWM